MHFTSVFAAVLSASLPLVSASPVLMASSPSPSPAPWNITFYPGTECAKKDPAHPNVKPLRQGTLQPDQCFNLSSNYPSMAFTPGAFGISGECTVSLFNETGCDFNKHRVAVIENQKANGQCLDISKLHAKSFWPDCER